RRWLRCCGSGPGALVQLWPSVWSFALISPGAAGRAVTGPGQHRRLAGALPQRTPTVAAGHARHHVEPPLSGLPAGRGGASTAPRHGGPAPIALCRYSGESLGRRARAAGRQRDPVYGRRRMPVLAVPGVVTRSGLTVGGARYAPTRDRGSREP